MSYWALTKPASLCQSNPKVLQLCSIENVFDVTSPKHHFHDDPRELAELKAFQHQFKMVSTRFCCIQDGNGNFITSKPKHGLFRFLFLLCHFCLFVCFPVHSYSQLWDGTNNKRKITVHSWKVTDRILPEARVAPVLQTEKPLTHPASCHHAKGSTNPPPQVAHWSMTGGGHEAMGDARKKPRRKRQKGASRQWNVASHST